jgi:phospholipase D-like protein
MLDWFARRLEVSTTVAAILLALLAVQLATQIIALVDLARRQAVRGGKKWPWALAIALGNLPGAVAYLAVGRTPSAAEMTGQRSGASGEAARRALDTLYGPRDDQ